jgi:hypothetical protein
MTEDYSSRERILAALHCQEPDRVPFLESVVAEGVALELLGRTRPPGAVNQELVMGDEPVLRGVLLDSPFFDPLELVKNLNLDSFGAYYSPGTVGLITKWAGTAWFPGAASNHAPT